MHHPEANELRLLETWNHLQNALLLPPFEVGLEADKVPQAAIFVFLTELYHRIGAFGPADIPIIDISPSWIPEANRFEGAVAHGVFTAPGQLFDGQTSFKEGGTGLIKVLELCLFSRQ